MLLDDGPSIKAAIATMNPVARNATQLIAKVFTAQPELLQDGEAMKRVTFDACLQAFADAGRNPMTDQELFRKFLDEHAQNALNLAVSMVLFVNRQQKSKQMWGVIGKVAALAGAAALGAFFG